MITHQLMGGLGNQLFQIIATIAIALRHSHPFVFDYASKYTIGCTSRKTYWDTLLKPLCTSTEAVPGNDKRPASCSHPYNHVNIVVNQHEFVPIDQYVSSDTSIVHILHGYYQSYKYFQDQWSTIMDLLRIQEHKKQMITLYPQLESSKETTCIAMHFRRGDYRMLLNCHPILQDSYYHDSLSYIVNHISCKTQTQVYYFCEEEDLYDVVLTVENLMSAFPQCLFERVTCDEDWQEMIAMSICQHKIIANSTFSLWGAYLGEGLLDKNSIVCYPSIWFGYDMIKNKTADMFHPDWKCIVTENVYRKE